MLYRPAEPRSLWGFWGIEREGVFHLFYDEDIDADYDLLSWQKRHNHIGHAVSSDLVHWAQRPSMCAKGTPGRWNDMARGGGVKTGCITRHEDKFYLFAGAAKDGVQLIGLWISEDLEHWTEHPDNPVLTPAGPYYLDAPTAKRTSVGWRDPGIVYCPEDGFHYMVLCAQLPEEDENAYLGTAIGRVRSRDLVHWEHLPPAVTPGLRERFYQIEEPEIFRLGDRWYLMFDGGTTGGMRVSTPARDDVRGSFYLMGRSLAGPFVPPADDLLVGNDQGARCATTGRVVRWEGEPIYVHFAIARRPALSMPKRIRRHPDGTLYLEYMPVVEKLETGVVCESLAELPGAESPDRGRWRLADGRLSGDVKSAGSVYRVADEIADFHLSCTLNASSANRAGVVLRIRDHGDAGTWPRGVAVALDFVDREIFIADARGYPPTGWYCRPHDICRLPLTRNRDYHLRCLVRDEHLEVYLDNRWIFTTVIPDAAALMSVPGKHYGWGPEAAKTGAVELMVERGKAVFSDLRLALLESLA